MKTTNKIVENLKYHIIDSTAMLAESTPIFAAFETGLAGMSDATSINARLLAVGINYAGLGYLFSKGRDLSKKLFKITDKTKEKIQTIHDIAYSGAFNLVFSPPMYALSQTLAGEDINLTKILIGTAAATGFGAINGSPIGYAVDVFRDLSGIKKCNRQSYPNFIKKQGSKIKKGILVGLIGASIGATGLIYSLTSEKQDVQYQQQTAQQINSQFERILK